MKILILGGTRFLGWALVDAALAREHRLTLFNRGQTNPGLFPDVEQLHGDRDGGLESLRGRAWDAVIDTCGYVPRIVRQSADLLASAAGHYTFISSVSAYADLGEVGLNEDSEVGRLEDESSEEITDVTYGPLKVLCEEAVQSRFPERALILRPGFIVGPHDPSDRFTYWPHRAAQGGEMACPGRPERPIQVIDVRDLAAWAMRMVEAHKTGVYNAVGPGEPLSMGTLLDICRDVSGSDVTFTWVDEPFLKAQPDLDMWTAFPIWAPESEPEVRGLHAVDACKAIMDGLTCRPVRETVRATLAWDRSRPPDHAWRTGLDAAREARLLTAWEER